MLITNYIATSVKYKQSLNYIFGYKNYLQCKSQLKELAKSSNHEWFLGNNC